MCSPVLDTVLKRQGAPVSFSLGHPMQTIDKITVSDRAIHDELKDSG